MAKRFNKPHLHIEKYRTRRDFVAPSLNLSGEAVPRTREEHGVRLREELQAAFRDFEEVRPKPPEEFKDIGGTSGSFLEVELRRGTPIETVERKSKGVVPTATKLEPNENRTVGLFVPDKARDYILSMLEDYANGPLTEKGRAPKQNFAEPIENIRAAKFHTYYTDDPAYLPEDRQETVWWEVWCVRSAEAQLEALADRVKARLGERTRRLYFHESVVIPVLATREQIEALLFARFTIVEIRRSRDTPTMFLEADPEEQLGWVDDLAERMIWPGLQSPSVCLLDTGVNRAHHLIEPALSEEEMDAVNRDWGVADDTYGHGTSMAGIALHGDLADVLGGDENLELTHRLESVKMLPPTGAVETDESFYGPVTQSAISLPEIARAERRRVYCMAISNDEVSGYRPTAWSAAIDQAASGTMPGDTDPTRRLILVATGNAPSHIDATLIQSRDAYPIEDPAQAWNAITVGGYTDKTLIDEPPLAGYLAVAAAGDLSPHTRTSISWAGKSAYKPDIVMEAGNRAVSPAGTDMVDADSLGLLSTGSEVDRQPLVPFRATSAAVAAAARLSARLMADHPDYWPETVRALIVHSAEWTAPMVSEFTSAGGMTDRAGLLRRYGYGVPSFERATASATNHLALIAQSDIQPYASEKKAFKDCHFYGLPWPAAAIEAIGDQTVQMKITLSYFIEPNPGFSSTIDPYRYQSFGLRFDLRRPRESMLEFAKRVNDKERERRLNPEGREVKEKIVGANDPDHWQFGPKSISAGSLHSDVWTGPAARLLTRNMICVYPIGGWWNNRSGKDVRAQKTRYALVVTLKTDEESIDLHTPIRTLVENDVKIDTPF